MPKRQETLYVAPNAKHNPTFFIDLMRYADPAQAEREYYEFFHKWNDGIRCIALEHQYRITTDMESYKKRGDTNGALTRGLEIHETNVLAIVKRVYVGQGDGKIYLDCRAAGPMAAMINEPEQEVVGVWFPTDQALKLARLAINEKFNIPNEAIDNPDKKVNAPKYRSEPRCLRDEQIPRCMNLPEALAQDISTWIVKIYGKENYANLRHEEKLTMVNKVLSAHGREFAIQSLAASAVVELVRENLFGVIETDRTSSSRKIHVDNFNRNYPIIKEQAA